MLSLGRDPYEYLKYYFERIIGMTNQDDLSELLPTEWAAANPPSWCRAETLPELTAPEQSAAF